MPLRVGDEESVVESCDLEIVCGSVRSVLEMSWRCKLQNGIRVGRGVRRYKRKG